MSRSTHSSDVPVDLADHDAAWHEGAKVCSDLIRDVVARLRDSPEWRLEVSDETGEPLHLFRLTADGADANAIPCLNDLKKIIEKFQLPETYRSFCSRKSAPTRYRHF